MTPVVGVAFCRWCRETRALNHDCQGLECAGRRPDGERCGLCPNDLRLQGSDPRYGSPSDLDHP